MAEVTPKPATRVRRTELDRLFARMSGLLTKTANALKGEPKPLHSHDWSDLPKVAAALRRRVRELERIVREYQRDNLHLSPTKKGRRR